MNPLWQGRTAKSKWGNLGILEKDDGVVGQGSRAPTAYSTKDLFATPWASSMLHLHLFPNADPSSQSFPMSLFPNAQPSLSDNGF